MRAIDTNVVVRFLTGDDPAQAETARNAIEAGEIMVLITVWLESEWVLRSGYGFTPQQIAAGFLGLAGLPTVATDEPQVLAAAIDWLREGMDFADALHLAKAQGCEAFLSFDRKLAKAAQGRSAISVKAP